MDSIPKGSSPESAATTRSPHRSKQVERRVGPTALIVGPFPPPVHGATQVTLSMAGVLAANGLSVSQVDTGCEEAVTARYHLSRLFRHAKALWSVIVHPPTVLYVCGAGGLGLIYQAVIVGAARLKGIPTIFHHHSSRYLSRTYLPAKLLRFSCGSAVHHIALSESMASQIRRRFPQATEVNVWSNASHVMLGGAGDQRPRSLSARDDTTLRFGHLSNLSLAKGMQDVVDVLRLARSKGLKTTLQMAGPTTGDAERRLIASAEEEFGTSFQYLGALDPADVSDFMKSLDIFLFPSSYIHEAEPMVVLEAAAAGVPTIARRTPGVSEVVESLQGVAVDSRTSFSGAAVEAAVKLATDERRARVSDAFYKKRAESLRLMADYLCRWS